MITKLTDIKNDGPYIIKIYNENIKNFEQFGEIFMFSENKFYNKDGTGPWENFEIIEIQKIVDEINNKEIKCYFEYFKNN